jgi:hypothetical protein
MNKQIEFMKPMIGEYLSYIYLQSSHQKPFPRFQSELLTFDKFCLEIGGRYIILEPLYVNFENHHNPFKFKVKEETIYKALESGGLIRKDEYKLEIEIGFEIGSIYFYEDDQRWDSEPNFDFIEEIELNNVLGSTIIINDDTGLRNIWINTHVIPSEQVDIETSIKFKLGNMFTENGLYFNKNMKFLAKIGNAPERT